MIESVQQRKIDFVKELRRKHEQFLQWVDKEDCYAVLGVPSSASISDIASAYKARWKEFLPEDQPGSYMKTLGVISSIDGNSRAISGGCTTISGALTAAFGVLTDPQKRKKYDAKRILSKSERARQEVLQKIREGTNIAMPDDALGGVKMIELADFDKCFEECFGRRPPILRDVYSRLKRYHDAQNPDAISQYLQAVQIQNLLKRALDDHKVSQKRKDIIKITLTPEIDHYIDRFEKALEYQYGIYPADLVFGEIMSSREFTAQTHTFGFCPPSLNSICRELKKYHEAQDLHSRYDCVLQMHSIIERANRGDKVPEQYKKVVAKLQRQADSLVEQYKNLLEADAVNREHSVFRFGK
jgi:curved DNA-binding protein CbpA